MYYLELSQVSYVSLCRNAFEMNLKCTGEEGTLPTLFAGSSLLLGKESTLGTRLELCLYKVRFDYFPGVILF